MIDPAGDAQHSGRKLEDSFERGISLQIAQALKKKLEDQFPTLRIVLTRMPGQEIVPLQNANFANRLHVDFYLSIYCYHDKEIKPSLYLYQFSTKENIIIKQIDLAFIPYNQAHLLHGSTTDLYGKLMHEALCTTPFTHLYTAKGVFKIPFKPLVGIKAPALGLELGLKHTNEWQQYIDPLSMSLTPIIEKLL